MMNHLKINCQQFCCEYFTQLISLDIPLIFMALRKKNKFRMGKEERKMRKEIVTRILGFSLRIQLCLFYVGEAKQ